MRGQRRYFPPQKPYFEVPKPGAIVHFWLPSGRVPCGIRGAGQRLKSKQVGCVTCPACLKLMNPPFPSQQPPCGSPAGDSSSMDAVRDSDAKIHLSAMQCSSSGSTHRSGFGWRGAFYDGRQINWRIPI